MTQTTEDDRLLIEAAQADPARFLELYERYVNRIYTFVSRRTENRAAAEDITSQVFEQALGAVGRFEWRGLPVSVWLFRIASNALADHWRERSRNADEPAPDVPDPREIEDTDRRIALYQEVDAAPRRAAAGDPDAVRRVDEHPRGGGRSQPIRRGRQAAPASRAGDAA